jgi:uncharacterized protein (DUF58 family)
MVKKDIQATIKNIKIAARRLMGPGLMGEYRSAFRGFGMEFEQLRNYVPGDDVRFIDWKSSARSESLHVKQFIEERDRAIILLIDISKSGAYGSGEEFKESTIAQVASIISLIAAHSNDKVGALLFSDHVEHWIGPKRGNAHAFRIIDTIFNHKAQSKKTNLAQALRFLINHAQKNSTVFLISDMIVDKDEYANLFKVASLKYDCSIIRVLDECEREFPNIGLITIQDPETGELATIKSGPALNALLAQHKAQSEKLCARSKVDLLDLKPSHNIVHELTSFFQKRIRRSVS